MTVVLRILKRPAAALAVALACAGLLWGALFAINPKGVSARVFFERGRSFFADFTTTRTCAEYGYASDKLPAYDACYPALGPTLARPFPNSPAGGAVFTFFGIFLWAGAFGELLRRRARPKGEIACGLVGLLLSSIMLHVVEWGNQIVYAAAGVTLFAAWFDAPSVVCRRVAACCLAAAVALKITPAAFGVVYLAQFCAPGADRRRVLVDFAWFAGAGLLLFFVPFAWYGGWEGFTHWLSNARANAQAYVHRGAWGAVPIVRTWRVMHHLDVSAPWPSLSLARFVNVVVGGACLLAGVVRSLRGRGGIAGLWLLAGAGVLLVPGNMHIYTGLYLLPVLAFRAKEGLSVFEAACWFVFLSPLQIPFGAGCLNHPLANLAFLALIGREFWQGWRGRKTVAGI